jgi:hypothetical protein
MSTLLVIGGIFTAYLGWRAGRWCSEFGRAKHDMHNTWDKRKHYRDD